MSVPAFHSGGDDGELAVRVAEVSSSGQPDPRASVIVVDPDGSRPDVRGGASGVFTATVHRGATVYAVQDDSVTVVLAAAPGDDLQIGPLDSADELTHGLELYCDTGPNAAATCIAATQCSQAAGVANESFTMALTAGCAGNIDLMFEVLDGEEALTSSAYIVLPEGAVAYTLPEGALQPPLSLPVTFRDTASLSAIDSSYVSLSERGDPLLATMLTLSPGADTYEADGVVPSVPPGGVLVTNLSRQGTLPTGRAQSHDVAAPGDALEVDVGDAALPPWISLPLVEGDRVTWSFAGGGDAQLVVVDVDDVLATKPRRWRWILPPSALDEGASGVGDAALMLALPPDLPQTLGPLATNPLATVHAYRFTDLAYDDVRSIADPRDRRGDFGPITQKRWIVGGL